MSDVQPSDAARQAAVRAYDDAPEGLTHQEAVGAALAAGLAVEYAALADKIETRFVSNAKRLVDLGWNQAVRHIARWLRAAAGGTPNA